ncbi:hypothetical protein P170DRAFT_377519 [Aspergillus steynii IBT 23096]|uniref:Uncharacterized protein n=1 Tax=Aspergillus steynii IBT 23096 TaxID=1392250 RepID=A0A2I2GGP8_9EURO|nr:uncharacterized protein P170DRAFT_377519 [Aspergillus steynii IBT 23096]PLB52054.1 hypothetical protein P170DRAFT_377519 [Aspergillus steynii IBT 23096]
MSVTINSKVVELDDLIPKVVDRECEDEDVERLIPWVFQHSDIVDGDCLESGPKEGCEFQPLFYHLQSYRCELQANDSDDTGISNIFVPSETITLPRKSWRMPGREQFTHFINDQCTITKLLLQSIYLSLDHDVKAPDPKVEFTTAARDLKYTIGGSRYATRLEGAVLAGPRAQYMPMIAFTGWFIGQTWNAFLMETFSAMLGQLTRNLSLLQTGFEDQEVFIVGFYGPYLHIARGFFTKDRISRVHAEGNFDQGPVSLQFTRGYDLFLKEDWLEATRALTRLLRYLHSGKSRVGAVQKERRSPSV